MAKYWAFALGAVAVAALNSAAGAADLLPPPPEPPPIIAPEMGGWYIRGDVGVGVNYAPGFATDSIIAPGYNNNYYNGNLSESALFDVGVGYQVNQWFRTDVTGELRGGAEFSGLQTANATSVAVAQAAGWSQFADFYKGHVSTALLMWNAYVDFGTWGGFTPWAGAGVGVAWNQFSGGTDFGANTMYNGPTVSSGGLLSNSTTSNLAWSLMAGVDMSITRQLKLELGYRYLNYGKFNSGSSQCLGGNPNGNGSSFQCSGGVYKLASQNLTSNDFRLGLRYYFDMPAPPPEMPIVRKY